MVAIVTLLLIIIAILFVFLKYVSDKKFRDSIMHAKPRLNDAEYLKHMPFLHDGQDIELALQFRTAFAGIALLPRECISPQMRIADLFRAQASLVSDGIDLAEIVMELEDQLGVEIREDSFGFAVTDDDTVTTLTGKLIEYAHEYWQTG